MARIAEDLLLLLLDNPSEQPGINRSRLGRVLAAALILDLAYDCRVRPALPGEPVSPGDLVALSGPVPMDPALRPTLAMLEQAPIAPAAALAKLHKRAEDDVLDQLLRTGALHQVQLRSSRLRRNTYRWPIGQDRSRVDRARSALWAALFEGHRPGPVTAAIAGLLYRSGGLSEVVGPDESALQHATSRAGEIVRGGWADTSSTPEVNLEITAATVLPAVN